MKIFAILSAIAIGTLLTVFVNEKKSMSNKSASGRNIDFASQAERELGEATASRTKVKKIVHIFRVPAPAAESSVSILPGIPVEQIETLEEEAVVEEEEILALEDELGEKITMIRAAKASKTSKAVPKSPKSAKAKSPKMAKHQNPVNH